MRHLCGPKTMNYATKVASVFCFCGKKYHMSWVIYRYPVVICMPVEFLFSGDHLASIFNA